jgi:hypothetical protein
MLSSFTEDVKNFDDNCSIEYPSGKLVSWLIFVFFIDSSFELNTANISITLIEHYWL